MGRYHILFDLVLAIGFYTAYCIRPTKMVNGLSDAIQGSNKTNSLPDDDYFVYYQGVQGKPGVDFPVLSFIPRTSFSCRSLQSGYYADLETDCQVFHICEDGKKISFLCPNGTIFEQSELICEWWFKVNCTNSPNLYEESAEQLREENARRKSARKVGNHGAVMRTEQQASVSVSQNGRSYIVNSQYNTKTEKPPNLENDIKVNSRPEVINRKLPEAKIRQIETVKPLGKVQKTSSTNGKRRSSQSRTNSTRTKTIVQTKVGSSKSNKISEPKTSNIILKVSTRTTSTIKPPNHLETIYNSINQYFDYFNKTTKNNEKQRNSGNDVVSKRLVSQDKDETQVLQESSSFYKNNINKIQQNYKSNPYPNHRETYSEIKEPKHYNAKILSTLSSVTPQYLSTQPINNGRPFIGSQVGNMMKVTPKTYFETTTKPQQVRFKFNLGETDKTLPTRVPETTPVTNPIPTELFNVGNTDKSINPVILTTANPLSTNTPLKINIPSEGSFNEGKGTIKVVKPTQTSKTYDHATVYGRFIKNTTPSTFNHKVEVRFSGNNVPSLGTATPKIVPVSYNPTTAPTYSINDLRSITDKHKTTTVRPKVPVSTTTKRYQLRATTIGPVAKKNYIYKDIKFGTDIVKPRPFQVVPTQSTNPVTTTKYTAIPSFPTYKISTAAPFTVPTTEPTTSGYSSPLENVDSMINALIEMAVKNDTDNYDDETPRPGLVVPPSAGPQTLHTLAVYFANALDGIVAEKTDDESSTKPNLEMNKEKLTELLTQMTMHRYKELFQQDETTVAPANNEDKNDLEGQHSKNLVETPRVRQLARVFTQALSSYLDDPDTFRRVLEEVRPTEPPPLPIDIETTTELGTSDDELLNFSDADAKPSFPPIFPTIPSITPTWGYIVAFNTTSRNDLDVKNSLNPEQENLQSADSQSFISQYNSLKKEEKLKEKNTDNLPLDHWTASPGVTKLWKTTFAINPVKFNENFGTTASNPPLEDEEDTEEPDKASDLPTFLEPHHEIKYELRALPKISLNSTQVHGILIDFMNTSKSDDSNRLQRILRKLNTTEEEFLAKMKEIESNPLTRRLILLLISECGENATKEIQTQAVSLHNLVTREHNKDHLETLIGSTAKPDVKFEQSSNQFKEFVHPVLDDFSQDGRALQLLNSLYTIASKFGK